MALKCIKRYTVTPDNMSKNISVVRKLKQHGKDAGKYLEYAPQVRDFIKDDSYVSPDGYFIVSKTAWGKSKVITPYLLLLGPVSKEILQTLVGKYEKIKILFYNGIEVIEAARYETLSVEDEMLDVFATPMMCGKCPVQASCLLSKIKGKVAFGEDEDDDGKAIDLSGYTWAREQQIFLDRSKVANNIIVNAAAGTGKTTVLNEALQQKDGILDNFKSEDIVLITFTNTAANEMKERVSAYAKTTKKDISGISISTWHSLALDILKENYEALGYLECPTLVYDEGHYKAMYLREIGKEISTENLRALDKNMQGNTQSVERLLFEVYYKSKMDIFLDVVFDILKKAIALDIFNPKVLIVDEFQDSSFDELQLIELLTRKSVEKFIALGDMRQAIYGFRGGVRGSFQQACEAIELNGEQVEMLAFSESFRLPVDVATVSNQMLEGTNLPDVKSALSKQGQIGELFSRTHVPMAIQNLDGTFGLIARTNAVLIHQYITNFKGRKDVYFKFGNSIGEYPLFKVLNNLIHMIQAKDSYTKQYQKETGLEFELDVDSFMTFLAKYDALSRYIALFLSDCETWDEIAEALIIASLEPVKIINKNIRVYLLTAHGSKGMEFDTVIILDPEAYKIKELESNSLNEALENMEREEKVNFNPFLVNSSQISSEEFESRKVAFVALSRAMNNLFFCRFDS